jgi:MFS family permease
MGALQSMNSGARVIGPLLAGALYAGLGHSSPYWFGLAVIAALLVFAVPMLRGLPAEAV